MVDIDIVLAKIATIQGCLKRIADVTQFEPSTLDELDAQDIFVLNLQRAVQAAINLAGHIVADEGLGLPQSLRDHFDLLVANKIISPDLGKKLNAMVGFRNIVVHEYQNIDPVILKIILTTHLKDIEDYCSTVLKYCGL
ncbi:DUF86 domain-containing protein [bacterium]|nr:DUF86 domain-containing protein [bacterium]